LNENPACSAQIWSFRLHDMLRDHLMALFPKEQFLEAGRQVAAHERDPYEILHEWLTRL
jgi:hypothetical protein